MKVVTLHKNVKFRLTRTGRARHIWNGRVDAAECGIPGERCNEHAPNAVVDGRYHLLCERCVGRVARKQEIASLTSTQIDMLDAKIKAMLS